MKEYIEREAAVEFIRSYRCSTDVAIHMEQHLNEIPAADVRPAVKAKWVYTNMSRLVCSNCGNPVAFSLKADGWYHGDFCPNCGARMEES